MARVETPSKSPSKYRYNQGMMDLFVPGEQSQTADFSPEEFASMQGYFRSTEEKVGLDCSEEKIESMMASTNGIAIFVEVQFKSGDTVRVRILKGQLKVLGQGSDSFSNEQLAKIVKESVQSKLLQKAH